MLKKKRFVKVGCESCLFEAYCTNTHKVSAVKFEVTQVLRKVRVDEVEKPLSTKSQWPYGNPENCHRTNSQLKLILVINCDFIPTGSWWCTSLDYWRCYSRYDTASGDHVVTVWIAWVSPILTVEVKTTTKKKTELTNLPLQKSLWHLALHTLL